MNIDVTCNCDLCLYNEDGKCCADMGIIIDNSGECETYLLKDLKDMEDEW